MSAEIARILIIIHAFFGGLALLSGAIAIGAKKGGKWHRSRGKFFVVSMLASILLSLVISWLPGHVSQFLFCIGLFSAYFVIGGYTNLLFRKEEFIKKWEWMLSLLMVLTGSAMIPLSVAFRGHINYVLLIFGLAAVSFGTLDFINYRKRNDFRKDWLRHHYGKMTGGYISAVTAFFVVNNILPGSLNWFVPTILGINYIFYWNRKIPSKKEVL